MSANRTGLDHRTIESIIDYSVDVASVTTPEHVLGRLHDTIAATTALRVLGANRFSVKVGDWRRLQLGKTVFVHPDVPRGWMDEWAAFVASGHP